MKFNNLSRKKVQALRHPFSLCFGTSLKLSHLNNWPFYFSLRRINLLWRSFIKIDQMKKIRDKVRYCLWVDTMGINGLRVIFHLKKPLIAHHRRYAVVRKCSRRRRMRGKAHYKLCCDDFYTWLHYFVLRMILFQWRCNLSSSRVGCNVRRFWLSFDCMVHHSIWMCLRRKSTTKQDTIRKSTFICYANPQENYLLFDMVTPISRQPSFSLRHRKFVKKGFRFYD